MRSESCSFIWQPNVVTWYDAIAPRVPAPDRLLDRQRALHPGGLVARDGAEEGVLAWLQVHGHRGRAARDDLRAAEVLAARIGDGDVVPDGRVVGEIDRHR